jgi:YVTN family beta-propeller protein
MLRRWLLYIALLFGVSGTSLQHPTPPDIIDSRFIALPSQSQEPSRAIALTRDGLTLLVVNPDSNSIAIVDLAAPGVTVEIPVGVKPRTVAIDHGRLRAFVANEGSNSITAVDLHTGKATGEIGAGVRPVGVAMSPDGRFLAVSEMGDDTVRFIDAGTLSTLSVTPLGDRPYGLTFTPDGRHLLISHLLNGQVTILEVRPYRYHFPVMVVPGVQQSARGEPTAMPAASEVTIVDTWPNVAPAPAVVVNAEGSRAYLPQTMANGLGLNTQFDTTVFPKVSVLDLESWSHETAEHISLPETDRPVALPWDVAIDREREDLWVVNAASNDISVIDISNPVLPKVKGHIAVGHNPRGVVLSPDGSTAYVSNALSGTISVIDVDSYVVTQVITTTAIPLPPRLLEGKRLFYSSARPELARAAWISCNSCHIEGEQDGRTWQLQFIGHVPPGERPVITRNTTSLLGMVETYPLRWSAEWDESADSEFAIRFEQFGEGLIEAGMHPTLGEPNQGRSTQLDSLAAFIDSLGLPARSHTLTPAEQRGRAIFESSQTNCLDCHPPPLYTDLKRHDVGTANAPEEWFGPLIDTPALRFLYDSAPYLHDGRAKTLTAALTTFNPNDSHGFTSQLGEEEVEDLTAFLLALPFDE